MTKAAICVLTNSVEFVLIMQSEVARSVCLMLVVLPVNAKRVTLQRCPSAKNATLPARPAMVQTTTTALPVKTHT